MDLESVLAKMLRKITICNAEYFLSSRNLVQVRSYLDLSGSLTSGQVSVSGISMILIDPLLPFARTRFLPTKMASASIPWLNLLSVMIPPIRSSVLSLACYQSGATISKPHCILASRLQATPNLARGALQEIQTLESLSATFRAMSMGSCKHASSTHR